MKTYDLGKEIRLSFLKMFSGAEKAQDGSDSMPAIERQVEPILQDFIGVCAAVHQDYVPPVLNYLYENGKIDKYAGQRFCIEMQVLTIRVTHLLLGDYSQHRSPSPDDGEAVVRWVDERVKSVIANYKYVELLDAQSINGIAQCCAMMIGPWIDFFAGKDIIFIMVAVKMAVDFMCEDARNQYGFDVADPGYGAISD